MRIMRNNRLTMNVPYSLKLLSEKGIGDVMTTKFKIISGFALMALLLGVIAFFSHKGIQDASDGFSAYRRLARFNAATSDLDSAVYAAGFRVSQFLLYRKAEDFDMARKSIEFARSKVKDCMELVVKPERRAKLEAVTKDLDSIQSYMGTMRKSVVEAYDQYLNMVQPGARKAQELLADLGAQAAKAGNTTALAGISEIWKNFANLRSATSRFAESRLEQDAKRIRDIFSAELGPALKNLEGLLVTDEGRKAYRDFSTMIAELSKAFQNMDKASAEAEKATQAMMGMMAKLDTATTVLSGEVDDEMSTQGTATLAANETSQKQALITGAGGFVLAVVFACLIVFGIVRVLNQLGAFAASVARGDFSYKISVRERGEIGTVIEAMKQIPTVLDQVISQAADLSGKILGGRFRDRLDDGKFAGSYADIAKAINSVSGAYTNVFDALPLPLMACDKSNSILFLNTAAQGAIGGNHVNSSCSGHLKAAECGNSGCFGLNAMNKGSAFAGETTIHPGGKRMDIAVSALPLFNSKREAVGYIEAITDLTEIKEKQAVMMRVARDASEIADRVAAASEELSAQVEQVSRGAEMQRSRVESTASAMTEMNATVLEVARSAGQASEQSEGTRAKANDGAELVNKVVRSINTVNGVASTLQENMQELGKQAESIGGVMNVISDIADQTNLLALNAAIEAARAGEAGRGFAVVADEVRKLAEKTMTATQEVGASITAIQHSARANINEVGTAVKNITDATGLANSSGEALKEIVHLASANSTVVASIATAAEEQSATSEEINRAIDEINRIVAETTDGMVQSSSAVQDLSRMAQELRRVMDGLK